MDLSKYSLKQIKVAIITYFSTLTILTTIVGYITIFT